MLSSRFGATEEEAEAPEGEASASSSGGGTSGRAHKRPSAAAAASSSTSSSPDGKKSRSSAGNDMRELLVRSSDGIEVAWPRAAVARSAVLANSLDDTDGDAPFPTPPSVPTAALVALMARWYHLDVKYDVSPPPFRPGDVTADCTYDLIFVSRRFARDLRARNVSLTPAGARALWKRTYGPPAGRGEEPPGWRRA